MKTKLREVHGEPSVRIASDLVRLDVTPRCGMMAPVVFTLGARKVQPYSLSPWKPSELKGAPDILRVLRGDFFCMPFGAGKTTPLPHGEPASGTWDVIDAGPDRAELAIAVDKLTRGASVTKILTLLPGQTAVYIEHRIDGLSGRSSYGMHPVLQVPRAGGPYHLSSSRLKFGSTCPTNIDGEGSKTRAALAPDQQFASLKSVPARTGDTISLENYPHAPRSEDLVMLAPTGRIGWTALTLDGYVWISLRRTDDHPVTVLWLSNGGRDDLPWNGRHVRRIGIEDGCTYFHLGLEESRRNRLRKIGIETVRQFSKTESTSLRNLHVVVAVPPGYGPVRNVKLGPDSVEITNSKGVKVSTPVDGTFLTQKGRTS
jgi:hypothetical protein